MESTIGEAARVMSLHRMRSLPTLERNKIIGQVSSKQIVRLINNFLKANKLRIMASSIMTSSPILIGSNETASSAKAIMKKNRIDHLPVADNDNLVGIVTSSDIMNLMLPSERIGKNSLGGVNIEARLHLAISGIVNKEVVTASVQDDVQSICDKMLGSNSSYCIVKLWEEVQGIITYRDIISLLGEKIEEKIPVYIIGLPDDPLEAELAKSKFANLLKLLRRIYPEILEARCRIKLKDIVGRRKRFEVDAHIITGHGNISYTANGYDLARIYDELSDALKKKVSHKHVNKGKPHKRSIAPPESY